MKLELSKCVGPSNEHFIKFAFNWPSSYGKNDQNVKCLVADGGYMTLWIGGLKLIIGSDQKTFSWMWEVCNKTT